METGLQGRLTKSELPFAMGKLSAVEENEPWWWKDSVIIIIDYLTPERGNSTPTIRISPAALSWRGPGNSQAGVVQLPCWYVGTLSRGDAQYYLSLSGPTPFSFDR